MNKEHYLLFILLVLLTSGCNKHNMDNTNDYIKNYTAKKMEEETFNYSIKIDNELDKAETTSSIIEENFNDNISTDNVANEKSITNKTDETTELKEDLVEENIDYVNSETDKPIELKEDLVENKIDCINIDECIEISVPIKHEFSNIINDISYFEVLSNDNSIVGYNIKYYFNEYKFETEEECNATLKKISEKITSKISNYSCSSEGGLIIEKNT